MNELKNASSPYLLQHTENPVHWKMWSDNSIKDATDLNKLLIISIGYSACHWCHVMEHESFEDESVAEVMNTHFLSIKIDREERPDVDAIYMKAVQMMTGSGGWPLNVVCLPNGVPIWGGTYFRKEVWIDALSQLANLFVNEPQKIAEYANQLQEGMQQLNLKSTDGNLAHFNDEKLHLLVNKWKKSFDLEFGGHARAPKFMMPTNLDFLMRYAYQFDDDEVKKHVFLTLDCMAYGGIFDTVHGGFSRYSVDLKWHIPHFEKMLYDNAQLISTYASAYKWTKNDLYKTIVYKTIQFIEDAWLFDEGGFYSALDADSLDENNKLKEGAFYVWEESQLKSILGSDFEAFSVLFNVNSFGFWEEGHYVLIQSKSLAVVAEELSISKELLIQKKTTWELKLRNVRNQRKSPRLDDKSIVSWNALMISGLLDAYQAFGEPSFLEMALRCARFIQTKCWHDEGFLYHNYKNQKAYTNGFLEDYATVIQAWISLFETTTDEIWLQEAHALSMYMIDHFYDENQELFKFKSNLDNPLMVEHFDTEDNVIPASNSIVCKVLQKMRLYFQNPKFAEIAQNMLHTNLAQIDYPSSFSNWLDAYLNTKETQKEVAICAENAVEIIAKINQHYLPNIFMAGTSKDSKISFLKDRFSENESLFYVCQNNACQAPTRNLDLLLKELH
uniref:thioredoxin domain-containing protein n=1 Tax=Flavobacterium sp. TaxID=239 RepID=UPI00404A89B5